MNTEKQIQVVATDLDGTLIPTGDESRDELAPLKAALTAQELRLVFVTGRHFASAFAAIDEFDLPVPECIICDVGTSVYVRTDDGFGAADFKSVPLYHRALGEITAERKPGEVQSGLEELAAKNPAWRLVEQESEKQAAFKQSYYCARESLSQVAAMVRSQLADKQLPFSVVESVDPFTGDGLIDVLPSGVDKGFALKWWIHEEGLKLANVIYSGDSGNDLAAFCTGVCSTVVGNATKELVAEIKKSHPFPEYVYHSQLHSTAAVLDGIRHFAGQ